MRFAWRHAGANVFVGEQLEVRLNFVVEIGFAVIGEEDVAQETSCFREERHAGTSTLMSVTQTGRTTLQKVGSYHGLATKLAKLARWPKKCDPNV